MSTAEMTKILDEMIRKAVDNWYLDQINNPYEAFYLYYLPAQGETWGQIHILKTKFNNWILADAQRISPAWDKCTARQEVRKIVWTLPIIENEKGV